MRYSTLLCAALLAGNIVLAEEKNCAEVDFIKMNLEQKELPPTGPYPLGVTLTPYRDGYLWKTPAKRASAVITLGTVPVKPLHCYSLQWEMMPPQFMKMLIRATYTDSNGNKLMSNTLGFYENSSAFTKVDKLLFTPPNVKEAKFELVLFNSKLAEKTDQVLGFWKSFKLIDRGSQQKKEALKDYYGKNLLPFDNFNNFNAGETDLKKFKVTPLGAKPYRGEIVENDGKKALKISYKPGDFQYIAWETPELPLYGSGAEIRCKIRGKGRIQLMVWYNRPTFATVFNHYGFFELSPEWKEYRVGFGCDDPLTQKVLFSFACRDNPAEFEVSELSLVFPEPGK
ncbi:MAG: hypothetical protein E7050_04595 [Lentisphaerae bacterium]|nr:hypothetical protein [Lentisphaerota bacterium]